LSKNDHRTILINWLEKKFGKDRVKVIVFKLQRDREGFDKNVRPELIGHLKDGIIIKDLPKEAKSLVVKEFLKEYYSYLSSKMNDEELHDAISELEEMADRMIMLIAPDPQKH